MIEKIIMFLIRFSLMFISIVLGAGLILMALYLVVNFLEK